MVSIRERWTDIGSISPAVKAPRVRLLSPHLTSPHEQRRGRELRVEATRRERQAGHSATLVNATFEIASTPQWRLYHTEMAFTREVARRDVASRPAAPAPAPEAPSGAPGATLPAPGLVIALEPAADAVHRPSRPPEVVAAFLDAATAAPALCSALTRVDWPGAPWSGRSEHVVRSPGNCARDVAALCIALGLRCAQAEPFWRALAEQCHVAAAGAPALSVSEALPPGASLNACIRRVKAAARQQRVCVGTRLLDVGAAAAAFQLTGADVEHAARWVAPRHELRRRRAPFCAHCARPWAEAYLEGRGTLGTTAAFLERRAAHG
jgi:hypothetical protein